MIEKWSGGTSTAYRYSAIDEISNISYVPPGQSYANTDWNGASQEDAYTEQALIKINSIARRYNGNAPIIANLKV